jgi:PKD repeat protein
MKYHLVILLLLIFAATSFSFQNNNKKVPPKKATKSITQKIPLPLLVQILDSTDKFIINDQTKFAHIDVPVSKYNMFLGYIKDSVANEIPGLKSPVYYNFNLKNGNIINGDIYWNDKTSYIVFTIDGKKYVNIFMLTGAQQLKSIFKL